MNHLEAQSYIMPFIEGRLPESKQLEFVMHMNTCKSCHEELEIYYTLINGMQQLDSKEELTGNYPKDLEKKLIRMQNRAKGRRRFRMSAFSGIIAAVVLFMVVFYGQCLKRVYAFEQDTKASMQGNFYFDRMIGDVLLFNEDRVVEENCRREDEKKAETITAYDKVKAYYVLSGDASRLWDIGDQIAEEKKGTRVKPQELTTEEQTGEE